MATTIDTSTAATATQWSHQRNLDRCQNGVMWSAFWNGTSTTTASLEFWYSTDHGATWTEDTAGRLGFAGTGTTAVPSIHLFIDVDDYAHIVYKDRHSEFLMYRRGTPNAGRTAWTWSAAHTIFNGTGIGAGDQPVCVAHREGTGWKVHILYSPPGVPNYQRLNITSGHVISQDTDVGLAASYGTAAALSMTIDFNHTGDGKTIAGSTPHLYAWWSKGGSASTRGIVFRKATYSAGTWTWGTARDIDTDRSASSLVAGSWLQSFFDGTRCVAVGMLRDATSVRDLVMYERDAADTTTTTRVLTEDAATNVQAFYGSCSFDSAGNVYVFGVNQDEAAGSRDLVYWKWTRSGASLGSETVLDSGVANAHASAKHGYSSSRVELIYTDLNASPWNVVYEGISLNQAPNAPTLVTPTGGTTIDKDVANVFDWTFSDPDAGDSQSAYEFQFRLVAGAWTSTGQVASATTERNVAGGTFAAGDYEWQVRTWDAAGVVGPFSASGFFTAASTPATPTITAPANGSTISAATGNLTWSTPAQTSHQVRKVADLAGSPDTGTVYSDSGEVIDAAARTRGLTYPVNSRWEHLQVRIKASGLWSAWASVRVQVSYTSPATPTAVVAADTPTGAVTVTATHPTPSGSQPAVTSMDVYRREGSSGDGIRVATGVAPGGSFVDYAVASGVAYEYRVHDQGDNGTAAYSAWVA